MARKDDAVRIGGLRIEPPPAELESVRAAMQEVLQQRDLGFDHGGLAGGWFSSQLQGAGMSYATTRIPHPVLSFAAFDGHRYWLGLELRFSTKLAEARFESASILVFKGAFSDSRKLPILRAEWERVNEPPGDHGQPHWHVYTPEEAMEAAGFDLGDQRAATAREFGGAVAPQGLPMAKMHFAMATAWHEGELASHYVEPTADYLADWIRGCCPYLRKQLALLTGKLPAGSDED